MAESGYKIYKKALPAWHDLYVKDSTDLVDLADIASMDSGNYKAYGSNILNYQTKNNEYFQAANISSKVPFKDYTITAFKSTASDDSLIEDVWYAESTEQLSRAYWPFKCGSAVSGDRKYEPEWADVTFTTSDGTAFTGMGWDYDEYHEDGNSCTDYFLYRTVDGTTVTAYYRDVANSDGVETYRWTDPAYQTVRFLGGDSATNVDLISWLASNGGLSANYPKNRTYPIYKGTEGLRAGFDGLYDWNLTYPQTSQVYLSREYCSSTGSYGLAVTNSAGNVTNWLTNKNEPYITYIEFCGGGGSGAQGDNDKRYFGCGGGGATTICAYLDWAYLGQNGYIVEIVPGRGGEGTAGNVVNGRVYGWTPAAGTDSELRIYKKTGTSPTKIATFYASGGKAATNAVSGNHGQGGDAGGQAYYSTGSSSDKTALKVKDCLYGVTILAIDSGGKGGGGSTKSYKLGNDTWYYGSLGGNSTGVTIPLWDRPVDDSYQKELGYGGYGGVYDRWEGPINLTTYPTDWLSSRNFYGHGGGASLLGYGGEGGLNTYADITYGDFNGGDGGYGSGGGGACYDNYRPGNGGHGKAIIYVQDSGLNFD